MPTINFFQTHPCTTVGAGMGFGAGLTWAFIESTISFAADRLTGSKSPCYQDVLYVLKFTTIGIVLGSTIGYAADGIIDVAPS